MDPTQIDRDLAHLYPPFAAKVLAAIKQADAETRGKWPAFSAWQAFETYRSAQRQLWLYTQGRSRPGSIVTNVRTAGNHGKALACDVVWWDLKAQPHWDGQQALWGVLGHCARSQGLTWGGDWKMHDTPHLEPGRLQKIAWAIPAALWLRKQSWR